MDGSERTFGRLTGARIHLPILLAMGGLLFFSHIACPLQEPEEPRYAEIPREMLESGQLLVPMLHGLPYYDKPPLLYWLVMLGYEAFGVEDWVARLVPCGAAFFTVIATYFWGKQTAGGRAGFLAAAMLCLAPRFVFLGRLLTMNSLLCLCVVAALACAHVALAGARLRTHLWLVSGVLCGLGILSKGPVALALIGGPVLAIGALDRRLVRPSLQAWAAYLMTAVGVASPWFLALAARDPEFFSYFFWRQNLVRFVAPFDHAKPVWYYVDDIVVGMLPWSLLCPFLLNHLRTKPTAPQRQRPAALGFALLASAWCFIFFSLAGSKRAGYILPAMPPLALALGCYLDGALGPVVSERRWQCWRSRTTQWALAAAVTFASLLTLVDWALPGYARRFAMRGQVRPLEQLAAAHEAPVACYPRGWDSVNFYLRRTDIRVYTSADRDRLMEDLRNRPETLAFIKTGDALAEMLRELPGELEFVPHGRQGNVAVGWVRARR